MESGYCCCERGFQLVLSQSIPTGYTPDPRATTGGNERIPATWANFCLIPCPGAKNDVRIPGGGAKFS